MGVAARLLAGSASGFVATAPMTVVMTALHGRPPWRGPDALPPRQITEQLAEDAGVREQIDERGMRATSLVNHFGYGAATGAIYGVLARRLPMPRIGSGVLFALFVWTISYFGWVPALRLMPVAHQQPAARNTVMIVAHVVWGASMGLALSVLERRRA